MDSTSTVSVWQAILVAALAGVGGGLLGTWARIRYERTAELRSSMIQAADDFATAAFRTIAGIRDLPKMIQDLGDVVLIPVRDKGKLKFHPDVEQATAIAVGLADELQERFARVQVLFGIQGESAATLHAWIAIVSVRNCVNVLRMAPGSLLPNVTPDDAGLKQWNENFSRVVNELDSFSQSARREIRAGSIAAAWRRVWNGPLFHRLRVWRALWRRRRLRRAGRRRVGP
jgi:hypothetical protein